MDLVTFRYAVELPEIDAGHGVIFEGGATCGLLMSWSWPGCADIGHASIYLEYPDWSESPAVARRSMMLFSNSGRPLEKVPQATSAWIQIGDRHLPTTTPIETEITPETAVELVKRIADGAFPRVGMCIAGTNAERVVRAINSIDPNRAAEIHAAIATWKARTHRRPP